MVSHLYGKFIPYFASRTDAVRHLLQKDIKFNWGPVEIQASKSFKLLLSEIPNLSYFDQKVKYV